MCYFTLCFIPCSDIIRNYPFAPFQIILSYNENNLTLQRGLWVTAASITPCIAVGDEGLKSPLLKCWPGHGRGFFWSKAFWTSTYSRLGLLPKVD